MIHLPEKSPLRSPLPKIKRGWRLLRARLVRLLPALRRRNGPEDPDDPFACVTAPKKPRLPHLSAAAVAELPER